MNTQRVCETQPVCLCVKADCTDADGKDVYDDYSCDCVASPGVNAVCVHCGEPMVVIDVDTGDVMRNGVVTKCQ
jgi:hypothetical protein